MGHTPAYYRISLRLYNTRYEFVEIHYEKWLEMSMGNRNLNQLCQLYSESTTENQGNLCPEYIGKSYDFSERTSYAFHIRFTVTTCWKR